MWQADDQGGRAGSQNRLPAVRTLHTASRAAPSSDDRRHGPGRPPRLVSLACAANWLPWGQPRASAPSHAPVGRETPNNTNDTSIGRGGRVNLRWRFGVREKGVVVTWFASALSAESCFNSPVLRCEAASSTHFSNLRLGIQRTESL